ncbi:hypothetical protein TNCV_4244351 [Trichonephila clavipes]|nr:hypothetical protein TNCV_4244351 [Trichonephila clavipes]
MRHGIRQRLCDKSFTLREGADLGDYINFMVLLRSHGRVVVHRASTPQVRGSINGMGKVDSAFHPCYIGSINEYQACLGSKTLKVSLETDYQIGTSVHAPQRPMVTYIGMGIVVPVPHGLLCH